MATCILQPGVGVSAECRCTVLSAMITVQLGVLYSVLYSDLGRQCIGDNCLSPVSALRLRETTLKITLKSAARVAAILLVFRDAFSL